MADKAMLIDTSRCTACRGCQVACKQWNELAAEKTTFFAPNAGYQNPPDLSADTYCLVTFNLTEKANGDPDWLFRKKQCMHCEDAACIEACPVDPKAMQRDPDTGFVYVNEDVCIGCRSCYEIAGEPTCPFGTPRYTTGDSPKSKKCWACLNRLTAGAVGGDIPQPACAKACPTGAIKYGDRATMISDGKARVSALQAQGKTEANLYGETEFGGLHSIYVLLKPPSFYGLPPAGSQMTRSRRAYLQYLSGVAKLLIKKAASF